jgi:hypothetical protein
MKHYEDCGIHEGRLICEKKFLEYNPDFDVDFYGNFHEDLNKQGLNKYQLMKHYEDCGIHEGRLICKKKF